jgi:phosphatidylinositol glycan class N
MHYYIYSFFPVFFLILGLKEKEELKYFFNNFIKTKSFYFIGYVIGIELLVYAFFHRSIFTIGYAFLGLGVPFILNKRLIKEHRVFIICWALTCCCTGIFSLLNPNKTENMVILWLGGIMMFCVSVAFIIYFNKHPDSEASKATHYNRIILLLLETINIFISLIIITNTSKNLKEENGLPSLNKNISWTIFLVSFLLPLIYGTFVKQPFMYRCVFIFIGMATPYIILSLSYEMAFYFFIGIVSILWIKLEQLNYLYNQEDIGLPVSHSKYTLIKDRLEIDDIEMDNRGNDDEMGSGENINISLSEENEILDSNEENENVQKSAEHRILVPDDLRISLIFYFLLTSAFFGTGNIASIASFSLQSVYRLITLYEPFTMAFLLILKIFIPFILPSICSSIICRIVDLPVFSIFALTTSLTDLGTINFFLHVRDEGSWLDIGVSISHFVIANCIQIFSVVLYCLTYFLSRKAKV